MRDIHRKWSGSTLVALALIIALVFIASPELRAILLFADSLGLDLVALLLATQLRYFVYALRPAADSTVGGICGLAFRVGSGALRAYPKAVHWRPFDRIVSPTLVLLTYGIRCSYS